MIVFALVLYALLGYGAFVLDWDEATFVQAAFGLGALLLVVGALTRAVLR